MQDKKVPKNIILGLTGSIALYKVCDLIGILRKKGFIIYVVMTNSAQRFISAYTFQVLSTNKVGTDQGTFCPSDWIPEHIAWAQLADIMVIIPATANTIAKISLGIADNLLTAIALSTKAPLLFAPAMNKNMYLHPATQRNIKVLEKQGAIVISPIKGRLACGEEDIGHLATLDTIVHRIEEVLSR